MFGLFRKTRWKLEGKRFEFFEKIFNQLPNEYQFLAKGLKEKIYTAYLVNHSMKGHHFSISYAGGNYDKNLELPGKSFVLKGIGVGFNSQQVPLNITVFNGLWIGFEFGEDIVEVGNFQLDLSKLKKERMPGSLDLSKLTKGLSSEKLDLQDLCEIDIEGKLFFQIKDLEDGNFLAIDEKGNVFGLLHDPFKVEKISNSLKQFVRDVNEGRFDFEQYLEGKSGFIN